MLRHALRLLVLAAASIITATGALAQAVIDPELKNALAALSAGGAAEVIVTFRGERAPALADLEVLKGVGIPGGITFRALPMVGALATRAQVDALAASPRVLSVFWNKPLQYHNYDARQLTGVDRLRSNATLTRHNRGLPVSGRGVGLYIADSGIDASHPDLKLGKNVLQNVWAPVNRSNVAVTGFQPLIALEDQLNTDNGGSGHGTHVAGTAGGTGQASAGKQAGVANGANIIGYGSGAAIVVLNAIGSFDYMLANQSRYGIRVMNNSWGSSGQFDPADPVNVASRIAAEKHNIVVVFSAGNSGSGLDTHNPYGRAPWVISVGNGLKNGTLSGTSSRGTRRMLTMVHPETGETVSWPDEPTVVAPGTDILSVRALTGALGSGTDPFYTVMSGTSMAAPHVAGIATLLIEANPLLTAAQVKSIIRSTATRMPGYESFAVGGGYANAFAAVQKAFELATPFGAPLQVERTVDGIREEVVFERAFDYTPASLPGAYKHSFEVPTGASMVEIRIDFNGQTVPLYGNAGNPLLLDVYDPKGNRYSAFELYFAIYRNKKLSVVVSNPMPGTWTAEVKALTPKGNEAGNFAAFPDRVREKITLTFLDAPKLADVQGHPASGAAEFALRNGFMAPCAPGSFCPDQAMTRGEMARSFTQFGAVRQYLPFGGGSTFGDVAAADRPFAEAVAARGAALRDPEFRYPGVMEGSGSAFNPAGGINRAELAKMLVRGVGGDAPALAHTGDVTIQYNGQSYPIADQAQIPSALRGYVHVAINSNILNVHWTIEQGPYDLQPVLKPYFRPATALTRGEAAVAITRYYAQFFK